MDYWYFRSSSKSKQILGVYGSRSQERSGNVYNQRALGIDNVEIDNAEIA